MEIEIGLKYLMVDFPTTDYAYEYCDDAGFYIGCVCEIVEMLDTYPSKKGPTTVVIEKDNIRMSVGAGFFEEYFIRSIRNDNLSILLDE